MRETVGRLIVRAARTQCPCVKCVRVFGHQAEEGLCGECVGSVVSSVMRAPCTSRSGRFILLANPEQMRRSQSAGMFDDSEIPAQMSHLCCSSNSRRLPPIVCVCVCLTTARACLLQSCRPAVHFIHVHSNLSRPWPCDRYRRYRHQCAANTAPHRTMSHAFTTLNMYIVAVGHPACRRHAMGNFINTVKPTLGDTGRTGGHVRRFRVVVRISIVRPAQNQPAGHDIINTFGDRARMKSFTAAMCVHGRTARRRGRQPHCTGTGSRVPADVLRCRMFDFELFTAARRKPTTYCWNWAGGRSAAHIIMV